MKLNEKETRPMKKDQHLLEELTAGTKDVEWLSKNYHALRKKYPKQYIAVKNQKVIIAHRNLVTLINTLKRQFGDPNDYLIDFVPDENYTLVV
ncbi:MAG: hypothetical protein BV459_07535 [Thermoplasmata archaeon M11B2D]|nr:MAG: hypothetical protein BV459_07535 [Thermoplasmata archaeon M11B2D]PNX53111.1 MAG: hypothetical protein BV458_06105 [Thermoplasmata archaeon M9B2D]